MSTQCTFEENGVRCKNKTTNPSGRCYQHPLNTKEEKKGKKTVRKTQNQKATIKTNNSMWIVGSILGVLLIAVIVLLGFIAFRPAATPEVNVNIPEQEPPVVNNILPTQEVQSPVVTETPAQNTPISTATQLPTSQPTKQMSTECYPLFNIDVNGVNTKQEYRVVWTCDGRLWQPELPAAPDRQYHEVSFTIEEGQYAFDGVECELHLDPERNGNGMGNPITVSYGNDLKFNIDTIDNGQSWAIVACRGNFSSGFQIRWLGPLQ